MTNCVYKYNFNISAFVDFIAWNKKTGMIFEGYGIIITQML